MILGTGERLEGDWADQSPFPELSFLVGHASNEPQINQWASHFRQWWSPWENETQFDSEPWREDVSTIPLWWCGIGAELWARKTQIVVNFQRKHCPDTRTSTLEKLSQGWAWWTRGAESGVLECGERREGVTEEGTRIRRADAWRLGAIQRPQICQESSGGLLRILT